MIEAVIADEKAWIDGAADKTAGVAKEATALPDGRWVAVSQTIRAMALACLCLTFEAAAQSRPPPRSGQMLGALQRDESGKIVLRPAGPRQANAPRARARKQSNRSQFLPVIARRGFIHRAETERYRRRIRAAVNQAQRNRRPGLPTNGAGLTRQQVRILRWLKSRDGDVRRHEAAHYGTGRPYTALPVFDFVAGPDGRRYAVSGHVSFRLPRDIGTGTKGLQILRRLRTAAMAPRTPSARDREVAQALAVAIRQRRNWRASR
jgi:hypothetical protein